MIDSPTNADQERQPLWSLFLAGPVGYALYFLASYVLGEFGCLAGFQQITLFDVNVVRLGVIFFTVIAAAVTMVTGVVSYRRWRQLRSAPDDPSEDDPKFMLFVGLWLNFFFTVVILLTAVPLLAGSACGWI